MHVLNPLLFPVLSAVAVVAYAPYKHFPSFLEISTIALFQLHFGKGEVHYKEAPNETVSGELCARGGGVTSCVGGVGALITFSVTQNSPIVPFATTPTVSRVILK